MTTAQTAANEFLRQFWLAIYPPAGDPPPGGAQTPAQKAAKAARMASFLERTPEKVDALVRVAQREGIDYTKVETVSCFRPGYISCGGLSHAMLL
jgi:transcription initiation factor TFIIH subunit 1